MNAGGSAHATPSAVPSRTLMITFTCSPIVKQALPDLPVELISLSTSCSVSASRLDRLGALSAPTDVRLDVLTLLQRASGYTWDALPALSGQSAEARSA